MSTEHENYASISMKAQSTNQRFSEPVRVPDVPEVFDRAYVLDVIRGKSLLFSFDCLFMLYGRLYTVKNNTAVPQGTTYYQHCKNVVVKMVNDCQLWLPNKYHKIKVQIS